MGFAKGVAALPAALFSPTSRDAARRKATFRTAMNPLHPKKLLLTKWTAVQPASKNKHFLVARVIQPEPPSEVIEWVELEAVYSSAVMRIDWRTLRDETLWRQGWV